MGKSRVKAKRIPTLASKKFGMTDTTVLEAQKEISRHSRELDAKLRKKHGRGD